MFGNADEPDEERLECMVKLLQTCGKKLDQTGSPDTVKVSQSENSPSISRMVPNEVKLAKQWPNSSMYK